LGVELGAKLDIGAEIARELRADFGVVLPRNRADIDADGGAVRDGC
jgi:hypothetical protein